jgi:hypothetical protein
MPNVAYRPLDSRRDPAVGIVAIDYSSTDHTPSVPVRGILVTSAGALAVVMVDGTSGTLSGLLAGVIYPLAVATVVQSGSSAAGFFLI